MRQIIPGMLWTGTVRDAEDIRTLMSFGIDAVVDLAIEESPKLYPREIIYCRFPLIDGPGNSRELLHTAIKSVEFLIRAKIPVLVACSAGLSRSPSIVAAALSHVKGETPGGMLSQICTAGPHDISPGLWNDVMHAIEV